VFRASLEFLPDGFRHCGLTTEVVCDEHAILTAEGDCCIAEVEDFDPVAFRPLCHAHRHGHMIHLRPRQQVALILAHRRSLMELSSTLERYHLRTGDAVTLLGGDGYAGSYFSVLGSYGTPVQARILGGIVEPGTERLLNTRARPWVPPPAAEPRPDHAPLVIGIAGVRMDSGKSTVGRNLARQFEAAGQTVAFGKVTGFGCLYETRAIVDGLAIDFTDFGLPSTCGPDTARIVSLASQVVDALVAAGPDVILLEFGGDLIGPYRVTECLEALAPRLDHLVFVAFDLCGVNGAVEHLRPLGLAPDTISGPIANNPLGVTLIREQFGLHAESSLEPMTETVAHISSGVSPR
jgi:hypothetical protein